jgi:type II secretory pathway pseudopilin PulG
MRRGSKLQNCKITKLQNHERGYIMITLMLMLALITIALLTALPNIRQQVRRDREVELIHRGDAYMRAIKHFYIKFGRYPARVEELENTNNMRFLRKRYTDPVNIDPATGKEKPFKFLTQLDISLNNGPVLGLNPGQNGQTPGSQSPFGSSPTAGGRPSGGLNSGSSNTDTTQSDPSATVTPTGQPGSADTGDADTKVSPLSSSSSPGSGSSPGLGPNGQTFGGGPIIGVASTNKKDKTIHVFWTKDHYNDWYFIYVQALDRGGLLSGPVNPNMPTANLNGNSLAPQQPQTGPGNAFGPGGGMGLNPVGGPGLGTQPPPQSPPSGQPPQQ